MIYYSWTALSENDRDALSRTVRDGPGDEDRPAASDGGSGIAGSPVAMGITDDRGRAMKAGEETLGSGKAAVVIIEAVRPGMAAHSLAPCYVSTGVGWLGRCTRAGQVVWNRFFVQGGPNSPQAPGRIGG